MSTARGLYLGSDIMTDIISDDEAMALNALQEAISSAH
jgi:hypothetical protein